MKTKLAIIGAAVCLARAAFAVTMASQPWTTNRIAEAEARVAVKITAATNAIPAPDFSQNNAQLRETIVAVSPPADLTEATNHTRAALSAFAVTGMVERARSYGTPTRWTDATGCVWEVMLGVWVANNIGLPDGESVEWQGPSWNTTTEEYYYDRVGWFVTSSDLTPEYIGNDENAVTLELDWGRYDEIHGYYNVHTVFTRSLATNLVGRVALTNDIPDVSGYATQQQATNAATAVADTKISTNNAAFVSAVLAVPLTGADAGDLAEIAEYGGYGTVGAALFALIAGLAALKRRVASAETALAQKANTADLPYRLVEPGEWEFSGSGYDASETYRVRFSEVSDETLAFLEVYDSVNDLWEIAATPLTDVSGTELSLSWNEGYITATRPSLPGHLCDRAGNRVVVSGDTTLTLPAAVPGYLRDFLVRLEISGSTVPTITFAAPTGETVTYETDGDEFPVPDEAGDWLYSFTETAASTFAVALKKVTPVAQGGAS